MLVLLVAPALQVGSHAHLIGLPYFWDEAGYYVPAANDLLTRRAVIPVTVVTNAHPPLLSAYISAWWKAFGQRPESARVAMLAISIVGLWGVFRLARGLSCARTGILTLVCVAAYPCYFTQSSMVLADLPSAGFSLLALSYYIENRRRAGFFFAIAVLWKETAILVPLTLLVVDGLQSCAGGRSGRFRGGPALRDHLFWTAPPVALLIAWYTYHWAATGAVFGNPEFFRYNLAANLQVSRLLLALAVRCWQAFGHLGMIAFTLAACGALLRRRKERQRLALPRSILLRLGAVVGSFLLAMSIAGGALLARYLLPVVPLIIVLGLLVARRRVLLTITALGLFLVNLWAELPYHYPAEENLAYRDFVLAHQAAARFLEREHPDARVATTWPATYELTMPVLGYVTTPLHVVAVERVEVGDLQRLNRQGRAFDLIMTFNREYKPPDSWLRPRRLLARVRLWRHADVWFGTPGAETPEHLAQALGLRELRTWKHRHFYVAVLGAPSGHAER